MWQDYEFLWDTGDARKRLYVSRKPKIKNGADSSQWMTPNDVDFEMSTGKNDKVLHITGMDQQGLEHFVLHYGKTYRYLFFNMCQLIQDFSPLEDIEGLEAATIGWNIRAEKLWNISKHKAFTSLRVDEAKRMTLKPDMLKSPSLMEVSFLGGKFNNYTMESLDGFREMDNLCYLNFHNIRLNDRSLDVLETLPKLEYFDFDAGMFTTEEIAWMLAKYPRLSGKSLCAYNKEDAILNDVKVCGARKPGLDLPKDQKRLDKYVAQFDKLVEKYRNEA